MFGAAGYGAARARYRQVDITSQVRGASPHRLITILYDELLKSLDVLAAGLGSGQGGAAMRERHQRTLTLLLGLEASLDHKRGGDIARGLTAIYREAMRLLDEGMAKGDAQPLVEARAMIAEVAEAWAQIG